MPRFHIIPTLAALAATGSLVAADLSDVQFHGFASQGYLYTTDNNYYGRTTDGGTFEFNEFALNAVARPVERVRVGVQIFAGDQGKYGNDKLQLDWAYGSYEFKSPVKWADGNITAGRFKTGHGLYNDYRDLDVTRTTVFLPMTVYPSTFRDLYIAANGFQLNGSLRSSGLGSLDISAFVGTQNVDNATGTPVADQLSQGYFTITNVNVKRFDGGSLTWNTPVDGLKFKGSFLHASDLTASGTMQEGFASVQTVGGDVGGGTIVSAGGGPVVAVPATAVTYEMPTWSSVILSAEYQHENLTLATEYLNEYYKVIYDFDAAAQSLGLAAHNEEFSRIQGAYASASYRFLPKWEGSVGGSWMTMSDGNPLSKALDEIGKHSHRGITLALRFDPTEHWLIKAEYQRNCGTLNISGTDNGATVANPAGTQSLYWNLFALKTTFDF